MLQVERFFHQIRKLNNVQFVSALSKRRYFTFNSFDIVTCRLERCFNIVAGVDGAQVAVQRQSIADAHSSTPHL